MRNDEEKRRNLEKFQIEISTNGVDLTVVERQLNSACSLPAKPTVVYTGVSAATVSAVGAYDPILATFGIR
jgi:hypothetical protein